MFYRAGFHGIKDESDPEMKVPPIQAAKRLAKGQVSDHIESNEVVPFDDVENLLALCKPVEVSHQFVRKALDNVFLLL